MWRSLVVAVLFAAGAMGACTTVSDTLYTPFSGTLYAGTIEVSGPKLTTAAGATVARWTRTWTVTAGVFSACLEPNDTATPAGTSYAVRYRPSTGATWVETWVVPTSASAISVAAIRVNVVPSPATLFAPSQIQFAAPQSLIVGGSNRLGSQIAVGTEGQCLRVVAGIWVPADCPTGGGAAGATWDSLTATWDGV